MDLKTLNTVRGVGATVDLKTLNIGDVVECRSNPSEPFQRATVAEHSVTRFSGGAPDLVSVRVRLASGALYYYNNHTVKHESDACLRLPVPAFQVGERVEVRRRAYSSELGWTVGQVLRFDPSTLMYDVRLSGETCVYPETDIRAYIPPESKISKLEADLKARDARIKELENTLSRLHSDIGKALP